MIYLCAYKPETGLVMASASLESKQVPEWAAHHVARGLECVETSALVAAGSSRVVEGEIVAMSPEGFSSMVAESEIRSRYAGYAQAWMDAYALSWGYDDLRSAASYVGDPFARFAAEGLALRNWRSAVWAYLDAAVAAPLPDPLPTREEFLGLLPAPPTRP